MLRTRLHRIATAAVASALILVGIAAAPAQAATVSVTGTITLGVTSEPAGANDVRIILIRDHVLVAQTYTLADGTFSLDVDPGDGYSILLSSQRGDALSLWSDGRITSPLGSDTGAIPMPITEPMVIERTLPVAGHVTGQVSLGGVPSGAGVELTYWRCVDAECSRGKEVFDPVSIGEDGRFELARLNYGWYFFEAWYEDWHYLPVGSSEVTPLNVTADGPNIAIRNFELARAGSLSGTVSFADGRFVNSGDARLWERTPSGDVEKISAFGGGFYRLVGVAPGTHTYVMKSGGAYPYVEREFTVTIGPEFSSTRNFVMQPAGTPYAVIGDQNTYGGTVYLGSTGTRAGEGEATVTLDRYVGAVRTPIPNATATTDANGNYIITGLQPIAIYPRVHYNGTGQYETDRVESDVVGGTDNRVYSPVLAPVMASDPSTGTITGRVALGSPTAFAGSEQVRVELAPAVAVPGHKNPDLDSVQSVEVDEDGRFLISDLIPGFWMLRYVPDADLGFGLNDWVEVGVAAGQTKDRGTLTLVPGGSIAGHIDVAGQPAAAGEVQVLLENEYGDWFPIAETDAGGDYVTIPLNTDYYALRLHYTGSRSIADEWFDWGQHAYSEREAAAVRFSPTAGGGHDANLQIGADFKGVALDTAGNPVPAASIHTRAYYGTITGGDSYGWTFRTESGADGRFDLRGLPPSAVDWDYTIVMDDTADRFPVPRSVDRVITVGQQLTTNIRYYLKNTLTATVDCAACTVSPYPHYLGHFEKLSSSGSWVKVTDFETSSINFYSLGNVVPGRYRMRFTATGLPTLYVDPFNLAEGQSIDFGLIGKSYSQVGSLSVSGSARVGSTLKATLGAFIPAQSATSYAWLRDGIPIEGAVNSTYTPTGEDLGHALKAQATVTRSGYTTRTITSAATAKVALGALAGTTPKISGTVRVGSVLTATPGVWSPGADLAIQWRLNGAPVAGATTTSYALRPLDVGKSVTVSVTATREFYATLTKTSAVTVAVAAAPFLSSPVPTVGGTARVGEELTVDTGVWDPAAALTYRWYADGTFITGATHETFTPTGSQLGKRITVKVKGTLLGYTTTSRTSAPTAAVARGVWLATPPVTVVGNNRVGSLLAVDKTGWQSNATFKYRWYANGVAIDGATKSTFTPTSSLLGKSLKVKVTTTTSGYPVWTQTVVLPTPVARGEFVSTPTPVIAGTPQAGSVLKVSAGAWSPTPTLKYQWLADGVPISGATGSSYTVGPSRVGAVITVKVTATRSGFTTVIKESDPTAPVAP